ncbi:MAG: TRAP transporter small permease [Hydrogenophaga sp.]|nr:TRAP transporter small permease [Hydrogenophaga sp.]
MQRAWRWSENFAALCLAVLVLITLANVLVRYFTDSSFAWTEEISVFIMVLMVFAGLVNHAALDTHIRVEFLLERGSSRRRGALRTFSLVCTASTLTIVAVLTSRMAWDEWLYGELSSALDIPRWWFTAAVAWFFGLAAVGCVYRLRLASREKS